MRDVSRHHNRCVYYVFCSTEMTKSIAKQPGTLRSRQRFIKMAYLLINGDILFHEKRVTYAEQCKFQKINKN